MQTEQNILIASATRTVKNELGEHVEDGSKIGGDDDEIEGTQ
jgi:hypothetical protein